MNTRSKTIKFSIFAAALFAASVVHAENIYKWVDAEGITHYGDSIPPEYSENSHSVLNEHGVELKAFEGTLSPEENEQKRAETEAAIFAENEQKESQMRDRVLLSTYLSVQEIEALRDRRLELVRAQIQVTEIYLDNLRLQLEKLEIESKRFSPYNTDPNAKTIDAKLARELADTIESIMLYERTLKESKTAEQRLEQKFAEDIARFVELTET